MIEFEPSDVGYAAAEILTSQATRDTRLKWVIVVDEALPAGRAVNAAVCLASSTAVSVSGLLGPDAKDAAGFVHPGLPWGGCTILGASAERLADVHTKAAESVGVFIADMPTQGQRTRVYDEYLEQLSTTAPGDLAYHAISLVGPRKRIDKLVAKLALLP